jgi:lantibiotic modifying enzyme
MRTFRSIAPPAPPPSATRGPELLAAAAGIGQRVVRDAVWYRGQCNWVAADAAEADGTRRHRPVHRALGSGLGHGTAGVALFLAQLHAATGDDHARRTALGAIGQALAHADSPGGGLYDGPVGIAYAAARCGLLLGDERLVQRAAQLARRTDEPADFSLATGTAGALTGLLTLARLLDDDRRLIRRAERAGDVLVAGLRSGPAGPSWPAPGDPHGHGLCGIALGAAGGALALLELHAVTADPRHRAAAERALDYERRWFDPAAADWPDLRGVERREPRGTFLSPYPCTWSHGAPGIALSRLRAWKITGDERYRAEAQTALATTASSLEQELLVPGADFTLARGLAGKADVLLLGAELASDEAATLARRAGEIAASRHAGSLDGWPCGAGGGLAPGVLAGHAGIGLFYMRLHDPAVPSPLLI